MKVHILAVTILALAVAVLAVPRNKRQVTYDEPRLSNEVIPSVAEEADESTQEEVTAASASDADEDVSTTTRTPALDDVPTSRPGNKKKKLNTPHASDTFSRVIDDIFNIPISVLRAVNTLLSNAFGTKQTGGTPVPASPSTTV